jgi:hypothetical protein
MEQLQGLCRIMRTKSATSATEHRRKATVRVQSGEKDETGNSGRHWRKAPRSFSNESHHAQPL